MLRAFTIFSASLLVHGFAGTPDPDAGTCPQSIEGKGLNKNSKSIGVIGGVGPASTGELYLRSVELFQAIGKAQFGYEERPMMVIINLPLDTKKEQSFIKEGKNKDMYENEMSRAAKMLMEAGVDKAVIPCNTIHQFVPYVEKELEKHATEYPQLKLLQIKSILDTTAELTRDTAMKQTAKSLSPPIEDYKSIDLHEHAGKDTTKVLLLATGETVRQDLYNKKMQDFGLEVYVPQSTDYENGIIKNTAGSISAAISDECQEKADEKTPQGCINYYETKQGGMLDPSIAESTELQLEIFEAGFLDVLKNAVAQGIKIVVLGCTDFQNVVKVKRYYDAQNDELQIVDSLDSLVVYSAKYMCGEKCENNKKIDVLEYDMHFKCMRGDSLEANKTACPAIKKPGYP